MVISLHDLEELSGPETAEVLGLPLAAVKSRLHRARLRLMAALRAEGVGHARS
jgi:DNA-directed RNA polymerase specialized sigma24 family protein